MPDAYGAVRFINSLLMSLAAVPTYLLARRLAGRALSLACAALAVAIPSLGYTTTVMTENAFYPLCVVWLLLLVLALERPTAARQAAMLGVLAIAFFTRAQAASFVGVIVLAVSVSAVFEARATRGVFLREVGRRFASFWPTWVGLMALVLSLFSPRSHRAKNSAALLAPMRA